MRRFWPGFILLAGFATISEDADGDSTPQPVAAVQQQARSITPTTPMDGDTLAVMDPVLTEGTIDPRDDVFGIIMDPTNPNDTTRTGVAVPAGMWKGETTDQAMAAGDTWKIKFAGVPPGFGYILRVETVNTAQQESTDVSFNIHGNKDIKHKVKDARKAKGKKHDVKIDPNSVPKQISLSAPANFTAKGKIKEENGPDVAHPVYAMLFNPTLKNKNVDFVIGATKQQGPDWQIEFKSFPKSGTEWRLRVRALNGRGVHEQKIQVGK